MLESTDNTQNTSLYAKSEKIYPREVQGFFQRLRSISVFVLLGLYYILPWLQWHDRQAILFDLPARKFHIFFLTFWPQDFFFLTILLILAGLSLFFVTAMAGRVWCGYACPQTVWTEVFIWLERWVEGTRAQQMKLSAAPWTLTKIRKRLTKQFLWVSFALLTGFTFAGYFSPIRELMISAFHFDVAGWSLFWMLFYGFATYGNAGFLREQVCKYMCPYARFQSAMFDKDTLIVAYDNGRGEPRKRGKVKEGEMNNRGDCIDCSLCVQVCPTGIDIREGLQYECIACAACIDVCDEVMERVDQPKGLIRYSSENLDYGKSKSLQKTLLRPRVIIYAALLLVIFSGFIMALTLRANFQVDILRDRNALYRWSDQQEIENNYQIKLMNKSQMTQRYRVAVSGLEGTRVEWTKSEMGGVSRQVEAGEMGNFSVTVSLPPHYAYQASQDITLEFIEQNGADVAVVSNKTRFWAPAIKP